ncbi:hypothetical protein [Caballeronia sp. LZ043]|uniref:hypothetical protein n=1 Tax=Caballeronia sp. LZ043 TaxID=3038569 RepID=UPI00285E9D15|nr:hypothetical protein [Caballeronia sp. LZ043]MDR5822497.1 hypothetical protein [Caballeronia sp. LZ043]
MNNASQNPRDSSPDTKTPPGEEGETFQTDVSESDEEGTTVREAEVREDDLSEVKVDRE